MSVPGVRVRPHLSVVGNDTAPRGIEVHPIDVEQLAANLNAIRANTIPEAGAVTAFNRMLAHAYENGRLAGLAEAGVA